MLTLVCLLMPIFFEMMLIFLKNIWIWYNY